MFTTTNTTAGPRTGLLHGQTPTPTLVRPTVSCGDKFMAQPDRVLGKRTRHDDDDGTILSSSPTPSPYTGTEIISLDLGALSTLPVKALESTSAKHQDGRAIAHYLNHTSCLVLLTSRNLRLAEEAKSTKKGLTLNTRFGYKSFNGTDYATLVQHSQPDIACALAATTFVGAGNKRVRRSVDVTLQYLQQTLAATAALPPSQPRPPIFAAIVGGVEHSRERQRCIEKIVQLSSGLVPSTSAATSTSSTSSSSSTSSTSSTSSHSATSSTTPTAIAGYLLAGFSAGETSAQRNSVVQSTLVQLPSQLPRMLECVSTVLDVLDAVSLGIDLISWSYPDTLTDACCAATFPLDARNGGGATTKICLRDASYARDVTPLVEGCRCYACQHHTKAYIHHLVVRGCGGWWVVGVLWSTDLVCCCFFPVVSLFGIGQVVHEILGQALLNVHNWYHAHQWCRVIREQIQGNTFDKYNEEFRTMYASSQ